MNTNNPTIVYVTVLRLVSRALEIYDREGLKTLLSKSSRYVRNRANRYERTYVMKYIWYTSDSHTEAYRRWMDYRIRRMGAKAAVGGFEKDRGAFQYELLKSEGLGPEDTLLDIGCGSLRAGRYFIDYLRAGNYTGMDISERAIEAGKSIVGAETLREKTPTFVVNGDFRFEEFDEPFDYIISHSVFAHLPEEDVRECLRNVGTLMHGESTFYFTYFDSTDRGNFEDNPSAYSYTAEELTSIAAENGLSMNVLDSETHPHPGTQRLAVVTVAE